jgi:hypothetical protein
MIHFLDDAALFYVAIFLTTWLAFIFVMSVKTAYDNGGLAWYVIALLSPFLLVAYLLDFTLQIIATLPYWELPQDWLFTGRLNRHCGKPGWRGAISRFICRWMLNPFQRGGHCHCQPAEGS